VKLTAVSVRHLSPIEVASLEPDCVSCFDTRIKLRLSFPEGCGIEVYTDSGHTPEGLDMFQDDEKPRWHFIDERDTSPGFESFKSRSVGEWTRLRKRKPFTWDWYASLSKHRKVAYSVFVRVSSAEQASEVASDWISGETLKSSRNH
jgi:hypothetical protein